MYALETIHALERARTIEHEARELAKTARAALHDVRNAQRQLGFDTSETDAIIARLRAEPITWRELVEAACGVGRCIDPHCVNGWTTEIDESYSSLDRIGEGSLAIVPCELH